MVGSEKELKTGFGVLTGQGAEIKTPVGNGAVNMCVALVPVFRCVVTESFCIHIYRHHRSQYCGTATAPADRFPL